MSGGQRAQAQLATRPGQTAQNADGDGQNFHNPVLARNLNKLFAARH
jgi:hypothetical protein